MGRNLELNGNAIQVEKGWRVYNISGIERPIIARKGGPTAEQVKHKQSYEELRKNQKEFGVASMIAKDLRRSLDEGMADICETYISGKLTAQFRNLAKLEPGKTGTRPILLSKHGRILQGFEFNSNYPYAEVFKAKYFVRPGSYRGHVILHYPAFTPNLGMKVPAEATHFKLFNQLIVLSDYEYMDEINAYRAADSKAHCDNSVYQSPMLPILKIPIEPLTAQLSLNKGKSVTDKTGLFLLMGVRFFTYQDGKYSALNKKSAMQIVQVY